MNYSLAETNCPSIEEQPVKVEAWFSKKLRPRFREMRKEFSLMGQTEVFFWSYPGENPSRVAAIGRCVPVYIAQHVLWMALKYYGEIKSLVHHKFVYPHWMGLGTSLFAESSQQPITTQQLNTLLDPELDTNQFHAIYQKLTQQDKKVPAFGLNLPNPKLMK